MAKKVCLQRFVCNIFRLTVTEVISSYEDRLFKIRMFFHFSYLRNEVGDPPSFFAFLTLVTHYLTVVKVKNKKSVLEDFRANVLLKLYTHRFIFARFYWLNCDTWYKNRWTGIGHYNLSNIFVAHDWSKHVT